MTLEVSTLHNRISEWLMRKTNTNGIRKVGGLPIAIATDIGLVRTENEDRVVVAKGTDKAGKPFLVAALSDGMGGMSEGAKCASIALSSFISFLFEHFESNFSIEESLKKATEFANEQVYSRYKGKGGATLSAVVVTCEQEYFWVNVGDSRIYLHTQPKLNQLTTDDTLAGQIQKNRFQQPGNLDLLQFIGIGIDIEPHIGMLLSSRESNVLITSDGVHFVGEDLIAKIANHATAPVCIRRLIDIAKWCGGHDNGSTIIISPFPGLENPVDDKQFATYELWDPFGEIQFVLPREITANESSGLRSSLKFGTKSKIREIKNLVENNLEIHSIQKPKRKKTPRKIDSQKDSKVPFEQNILDSNQPQLIIEFPTKLDKSK